MAFLGAHALKQREAQIKNCTREIIWVWRRESKHQQGTGTATKLASAVMKVTTQPPRF